MSGRAVVAALAVALLGAPPSVARADDPAARLDAQGRAMLDPMREVALRPAALVAALGLRPTDVVVDVGAGPGFLTLPLARALPRGRVIATDVRADYLEVLAARAKRAGLANVETRVVEPRAPGLAPRSVDVALLCQLDHGLADRVAYFAQVAAALRPGGKLVLVNYVRYRMADKEAAARAGLELVREWEPSPPFFLQVWRPR